MPPLPADSIHARACKLKCEKILTRPGGKVLLLLSHKKVTKRLPNRYLYGKMTAVRKRKNRAEERKGERYRNNDFRHDGPGKHPAQ